MKPRLRSNRSRLIAPVVVAILLAAACGDDDGSAADGDTSPADVTTTEPEGGSDGPAGTDRPAAEWEVHGTGPDCLCADGSDFVFFSREASPDKVLLYYQGGGACFTEDMCSFEDGTYKPTTGAEDTPSDGTGIFDFERPDNPFADHSVIFVPYCTGDVHIGDATTSYGDLTVEHNGFVNASHGLDFLVETYPDAAEVFVTGSSAGGVPAPLFGALAADALPDASVAVLADASGGYPSNPPTNAAIGGLWGTAANIPDWPELDGLAAEDWGIPDLFLYAGTHAPEVRMARYDNAFDEVQREFSAMAGVGEAGLPAVLEQNEALVEDGGVDLSVYIAPGDDHTILGDDQLYDLEVEGVGFLDWLAGFAAGADPGDVRCVECGEVT